MPCKNSKCEQRLMSEEDLILNSIRSLEQVDIPKNMLDDMDINSMCADCARQRLANWLREYLKYLPEIRKLRNK